MSRSWRGSGGAVHLSKAAIFSKLVRRNAIAVVFDCAAAPFPVDGDVHFGRGGIEAILEKRENDALKSSNMFRGVDLCDGVR